MGEALQTVVELSEFQRKARRLLSDVEVDDLITYLARYPRAGDVIRGSGGVRKLRWARQGRGKSGGVRVITYFSSPSLPLFLVSIYGKSARDDLKSAEVAAMKQLTAILRRGYGRKT